MPIRAPLKEPMRTSPPTLGLVIPCYNEQEVLPETTARLIALLGGMQERGEIADGSAVYYVDDGSRDGTWSMIEAYAQQHDLICGIKLSRNRGHQNALLCGLLEAPGDILISVDADLQDDLDVIPQMVRHYREGSDIVYGVRRRRDKDTWFKRLSAEGYYKLLAALKVEVVFNHADYRLMSRKAIETLREYREPHLFLRALVPRLGYRSSAVEFDRAERFAGESKYPLRKMLALAWEGISSFTAYPLRLITGAGILISLFSLGIALWALGVRLLTTDALPGWASTVIPMYFLGGVQLLALGVIGEYLAKVFDATKQRPRYHVETVCGAALQPLAEPADAPLAVHRPIGR
jgi:glycosyltransferase involved in cell wall biosynthesis